MDNGGSLGVGTIPFHLYGKISSGVIINIDQFEFISSHV